MNIKRNKKRNVSMFAPYVSRVAIQHAVGVLESGWVGEGPNVKAFEEKVGQITGAKYPVAVNSGTSALHVSLIVAGIKPGDEVITTAQTMLATTQAILMVRAKPVYADVQYETGNIDPKSIEEKITNKTKAIVTVDWAGYPCDYDEIRSIAKKHTLIVIEDAAHALGATYKNRHIGSVCPYTCFSFQAIKHITTGDGGMLCVPTTAAYQRAKRLRWFGIDREKRKQSILGEPVWDVKELGYKYHMNDIAAAIGLGNLKKFDQIIAKRRAIAKMYNHALRRIKGIQLFNYNKDRESAYWLYSIHVERRENFAKMMHSKGVDVSVVHLRIDKNTMCGGARKDLVNLKRFTETHISLPIHNALNNDDIHYVIRCIKSGW